MIVRQFDDATQIVRIETPQAAAEFREGFAAAYVDIFSADPYFEDISLKQARSVYDAMLDFPDSICLIAISGDSVVGFGIAVPLACIRSVSQALVGLVSPRHTYYLAELGVCASHRGKGLGRALIFERLRCMDSQRYSNVVLRVSENKNTSLELYRSMGFEDMGVAMDVMGRRVDGTERTDRRVFLSRVLSQTDVE